MHEYLSKNYPGWIGHGHEAPSSLADIKFLSISFHWGYLKPKIYANWKAF
jgi:hypothetical protein